MEISIDIDIDLDIDIDIDMDIDVHTNETHVLDIFRIPLQVNISWMPVRPGRKNATRKKGRRRSSLQQRQLGYRISASPTRAITK